MTVTTIDEIKKKIGEFESEIVSVSSNLIRLPTVSPPGETRECAEYIKSYFDDIGLKARLHEIKKNKTNVHVKVPGKNDRTLIWLGHVDVVPAGLRDSWIHEPFGGDVCNDRVYGRGASDMKGSCAAAMVAAKILGELDDNRHATIDFWFTCDEEVGATDGTRWLVQEGLISGDACVIGDSLSGRSEEPMIDMGCKGYMRTHLKASGKTAHGAMPFYGDNAVDKLIRAIEKARQIGDFALALPHDIDSLTKSSIEFLLGNGYETEDQKTAITRSFLYPTVSLNLISGGVKVNVVPDSAEATFDIRITPGVDIKLVERHMLKLLDGVCHEGIEAKTVDLVAGYYEKLGSPFAESLSNAVRLATGAKPSSKILMGATDAIPIRETLGIPCLGFGAGIEELAHAPNEYVTVKRLVVATKVYSILPVIF